MQTTGLVGRDSIHHNHFHVEDSFLYNGMQGHLILCFYFLLYYHHGSSTTYCVISVKFLVIAKLQFSHV